MNLISRFPPQFCSALIVEHRLEFQRVFLSLDMNEKVLSSIRICTFILSGEQELQGDVQCMLKS